MKAKPASLPHTSPGGSGVSGTSSETKHVAVYFLHSTVQAGLEQHSNILRIKYLQRNEYYYAVSPAPTIASVDTRLPRLVILLPVVFGTLLILAILLNIVRKLYLTIKRKYRPEPESMPTTRNIRLQHHSVEPFDFKMEYALFLSLPGPFPIQSDYETPTRYPSRISLPGISASRTTSLASLE
ncbi:hypothetical protein D9758_009069 [Tetrapyrgos nigripes]|uniref:Uncharacterized protein n=1 Tax=Tetrapyrgos nigripes TaxID=182062 RepID=A0A8H5GA80_9AGAR|nr:hypothetical protein D9758_009069 [Tetrapyrgos nigripes]